MKPRLRSTDVAELAQRSVRRYAKLLPEREIVLNDSAEVADVRVDQDLIDLAISQLVENACRYSWPDTVVRIEVGAHDGKAAVVVWNAGSPIPERERQHIFERFYRGTEARRSAPGSGLGLYAARKIALAHGGDLVLLDERAGEVGFRMTLPFAEKPGSDDQHEV